jgi:hypothetical protein
MNTPVVIDPNVVDALRQALPKSLRNSVTPEAMNNIAQVLTDPDAAEYFKENLLSYTGVMADGRFKVTDYINAVRYVSYKLLGSSNIQAHLKTFPDKHKDWAVRQVSAKDISSYVHAYNNTKLVNLIYEQTVVPTWVLNQHHYQQAINVQAELMYTAKSEKVRSDAANSLLTHLKKPETQKVEMEVTLPKSSIIDELEATTRALVEQQKAMLMSGGMTLKEVAHSRIIDVEAEEV